MSTNKSLEIAMQLHQQGQQADAAQRCRDLLQQQPDQIDALLLLGIIACQTGQVDEGISCFEQVLILKPQDANTHNNLGNAFRTKGQLNPAIAHYQTAIALNARHADAHYNLGVALQELGDSPSAVTHYRQAIDIQPHFPAAHHSLGTALRTLGKIDDAIAAHQRALALDPTLAEAYDGLGNALREDGRLEEALTAHQQAIARQPTLATAHYNLGNTLLDQGETEGAIASYSRAIELNPPYYEARMAKAMGLLLSGEFSQGFAEYESRWGSTQSNPYPLSCPAWDGSPLQGRTILLLPEQGLGDTIQFIRYATVVAQMGGRVIAGCNPSLTRLLATVPGISQVISDGDAPPPMEVYASLMSLPHLLHTTETTIPAEVPYVNPPALKHPLAGIGNSGLNVGIVWAARDIYHARYTNRRRSCPLIAFQRLLSLPGIRFYSLQKGDAGQDLTRLGWQEQVQDCSPEIQDFADTGAIAMQLDLIITVDTAVAHLAGALAKPVWVLLPFAPDWRWMLNRDDSPWYPTMRLFRQRYPGDWAGVIESVVDALKTWSGGL